jgi:hypothetical protein
MERLSKSRVNSWGHEFPQPPRINNVTLLLPRRDVGAAIASESLGRHDLVVHRSQIHAMASPRVDMVGKSDGVIAPSRSFRCADTPVLREGPVALDIRSGFTDLIYVVGATVTSHSS